MNRLVILGLVAVLAGGCVAPSEPEGRADLAAAQDGWPQFNDALDYSAEAARQRALLTQEEFDTLVENERDWEQALLMFDDVGTLRVYRDAGWWKAFVDVALWNADDRGDRQARRDVEAYDETVREVLR